MPQPATAAHGKHQLEATTAIPGGYTVRKGRPAVFRPESRSPMDKPYIVDRRVPAAAPEPAPPRPTLLENFAKEIRRAPWAEKEARRTFAPGTRRLKDLTRAEQRPLESRLYHLRKVHQKDDKEISALLDLHPADLDALAATSGEL